VKENHANLKVRYDAEIEALKDDIKGKTKVNAVNLHSSCLDASHPAKFCLDADCSELLSAQEMAQLSETKRTELEAAKEVLKCTSATIKLKHLDSVKKDAVHDNLTPRRNTTRKIETICWNCNKKS